MDKAKRKAQAILRQWPAVVAESLGLRPSAPMEAALHALPDREHWEASRFAAVWLGHATALLRVGGITVITDPHFEERAGLDIAGVRIGRRRSVATPAAVEDLPPVDLVVLSHAHLDHWDRVSLARLARRRTTAIIPRGTRRLLPEGFGQVVELHWGEEASAHDIRLTAYKPNHWGARWLIDRRRGYNAYLLEADHKRVVYTGDTAQTNAFDPLSAGPKPGVDLAIMCIGGYHAWDHRHATPEQVAEMASRMSARRLMPVHHSTFHDAAEPPGEALDRLREVWRRDAIICDAVGAAWFHERESA